MNAIRVLSFAKINLYLKIHDARKTGFHDISTLFHSVSLSDEVTVEVNSGDHESSGGSSDSFDIQVTSLDPTGQELDLPTGRDNLAASAAHAFLENYSLLTLQDEVHQYMDHINIVLRKLIPAGAGLAGGSGNAAAVLAGLDIISDGLCGVRMPSEAVVKLASGLGSDVPFCLTGGCMEGAGRGDELTPCPALPYCYIVIMIPTDSISTSDAYRWLDELRSTENGESTDHETPGGTDNSMDLIKEALLADDLKGVASAMHNDFEEVVLPRYPVVADLKQLSSDKGALGSILSGSGSAVFAIFDDQDRARSVSESALALSEVSRVHTVAPMPAGWKILDG